MPKPLQPVQAESRPPRASGGHHVVAAALFLMAWLSFVAFVALFRAPLPTDAFAALTMELVAQADTSVAR
jgi:hypothetical protein